MEHPYRLTYLSSGLHRDGRPSLVGLDSPNMGGSVSS
jgi:hypothetical protein